MATVGVSSCGSSAQPQSTTSTNQAQNDQSSREERIPHDEPQTNDDPLGYNQRHDGMVLELDKATPTLDDLQSKVGESADNGAHSARAPTTGSSRSLSQDQTPTSDEALRAKILLRDDAVPPTARFFLYLQYPTGIFYVLPWDVAATWETMQPAIKILLKKNPQDLQAFEEGRFNLEQIFPNRVKMFLEFYDTTVQPGQELNISFRPSDDEPSASTSDIGEEGEKKTKYDEKVRYTLHYYRRNQFDRELSTFESQKSFSEPIEFATPDDKSETLSVLEEIKRVTLPPGPFGPPPPPPPPPPLPPGAATNTKSDPKPDTTKPTLAPGSEIGMTSLKINSPYLLNTLQALIKYSSLGTNLKEGIFDYPFRDLYCHMGSLLEYKQESNALRSKHSSEYTEICDQHIDQLAGYLYDQSRVHFKELEVDWNMEEPMTNLSGVAFLLKPGSDVYALENDVHNAYVVERVSGGIDYSKEEYFATPYSVWVWKLVFNGKSMIRALKKITVPVFDDKRRITSLPVFPTRFLDLVDNGAHRQRLIKRGQKYFSYCEKPAFLEYSGSGLKPGWKKYTHTRVVVQHSSRPWSSGAFEWQMWFGPMPGAPPPLPTDERVKIGEAARTPGCHCKECVQTSSSLRVYTRPTYSDYDDINPTDTERSELTEHQYLLCDSHMFGFVLKDREYDLLDVEGLKDPSISERAIDRLVMKPESNKETIKAIVKTYTDRDENNFRADFIHGKGEGQIILLHGPPGTGKTLTAESVAEYTRRPLLSITAADLGHDPEKLERNLLSFFKDASEWDAVVLLDEADVYLQRREAHDLIRNSVVSIFLRALEYFQGILFLTTNRVGQFDEAFMSRIHVAIGYDPLDDDAREQIWDNLFKKLEEDYERNRGLEISYQFVAKEYVKESKAVKELMWNGREIRNAFQTAVALAVYDSKKGGEADAKPKITQQHLEQVVKMSSAFKKYIKSTHQDLREEDLAYRYGNRDDDYHRRSPVRRG